LATFAVKLLQKSPCLTALARYVDRMSNRELAIEIVQQLPPDTPLKEIAREIELRAGIEAARAQVRRGEGQPVEQVRKLVDLWASPSS
jgi:class 3 adenylate cyclase